MNQQNALEYVPLLQALADGELEENAGTEDFPHWITKSHCHFTRVPAFYRRKPKPVSIWLATKLVSSNEAPLLHGPFDKAEGEAWIKYRPGFKLHELDCGEAP